MHRFIIVGGGAGGLELATRLGDRYGARGDRPARALVTLVDRYPTHIWKPLLHEVAAGSMDPFTQELEYAAQARWHGFEFHQGELIALDRASRRVTLAPVADNDGAELLRCASSNTTRSSSRSAARRIISACRARSSTRSRSTRSPRRSGSASA